MKMYEEITKWGDETFFCEYIKDTDFSNLTPITQVQALCFTKDGNFVIFEDSKGRFGLPGGTVESGESLEEALARELYEEAAVKIIEHGPLLHLRVTNLSSKPSRVDYQVRYWANVELLDEKVSDPAGKAVRRHVVNKKELFGYVKWGKKLEIYYDEAKKLGIVQ